MNPNNFRRPMKPNFGSYPNNDDLFIPGGALAPFLLGGITGGLLAPAFYPRPIMYPPVYRPYPVYPVPYTQSNQYYYYN